MPVNSVQRALIFQFRSIAIMCKTNTTRGIVKNVRTADQQRTLRHNGSSDPLPEFETADSSLISSVSFTSQSPSGIWIPGLLQNRRLARKIHRRESSEGGSPR